LGEGKKVEVCSTDCKTKAEREKLEKLDGNQQEAEKVLIKSIKESYNETIKKIKNIFAPFYEVIKEVRINELKRNFLERKIKPFEF